MAEPTFTDDDLAYVTAEYHTLQQLCTGRAESAEEVRGLIAQGRLPRPTYVLPDGTELFPPDYFMVLDGAGDVDGMRDWFDARHRAASTMLGLPGVDPEEDWRGYLSGEFGVCLREVTPEAMVEKSALIATIDTLTAAPAVDDEGWRAQLREAVDDLDELERPFTDYDRQRWGGTSRDSHITAVRARFLDGQ
jgi:Family of unknown function (DUF6058)